MKDSKEPIVLTGKTLVTGALAEIFPSRELVQRNAKVGDMKLWCHLKPGARVWSGQFRSAIFDGKKWRTFRLNVVADSDVRYDTFDERPIKARRCFDAITQLKGQTARIREDGTWGCNFTMKAPELAAARVATPAAAEPVVKPGETRTDAAPVVKPVETRTDAAPVVKPAETRTDATPVVKPAGTTTDAATVAKPLTSSAEGTEAPATVTVTVTVTTSAPAAAAKTSQVPPTGTFAKQRTPRRKQKVNPDQLTLF